MDAPGSTRGNLEDLHVQRKELFIDIWALAPDIWA